MLFIKKPLKMGIQHIFLWLLELRCSGRGHILNQIQRCPSSSSGVSVLPLWRSKLIWVLLNLPFWQTKTSEFDPTPKKTVINLSAMTTKLQNQRDLTRDTGCIVPFTWNMNVNSMKETPSLLLMTNKYEELFYSFFCAKQLCSSP